MSKTLNLMHARLPTSLIKYIASVGNLSTKLQQQKLIPPVVLAACYDCNGPWNLQEEEEQQDKEGSSAPSASSKKIPRLSFREGDNIILLEQGSNTNNWIGYFDNIRVRAQASFFFFIFNKALTCWTGCTEFNIFI